MCLINFHLREHPKYKLIIAANRDEFYERPTATAHFWEDHSTVLAGRDLLQLGTWLGITKEGRIAALTNYRDPSKEKNYAISRGEVITNYLISEDTPRDYLTFINQNRHRYNGFNLIVGNQNQLYYYNNVESKISKIPSGTHGLSNHMLNTSWPKVEKGKQMLRDYVMNHQDVEVTKLFEILSDSEQAQDLYLPQTGIDMDLERKLSPLFIKTPNYGTRNSTVLLIDNDNFVTFVERTYQNGVFMNDSHFTFQIN